MVRVSLKKAGFRDIEFLWYLRNRPEVFKFFRNPVPTSFEKHLNWVMPILLGLAEKKLWIVGCSGQKAGQVRLDFGPERKSAQVSISLLKEFQGKGIAKQALKKAFRRAKGVRMKAAIHKDNLPSLKLFENLGFQLKEKGEPWLEFIYEN